GRGPPLGRGRRALRARRGARAPRPVGHARSAGRSPAGREQPQPSRALRGRTLAGLRRRHARPGRRPVPVRAPRRRAPSRAAPGPAQRLAALDSPADELAPGFGGGWLYFASDRAGGAGGLDLWRASFAEGVTGEPEHLGGALASAADDTDPAPCARPGELVF